MLLRLLREYLAPYKGALVLVVVFQFLQSLASLYLPTLNAQIIDEGVAQGDTGLIWGLGAIMLVVTLAQVASTVIAVYFGARTAMRAGRDMRREVFSATQSFSEHEVASFGTGSLITRNTNDIQQVQMLVLMSCTMLVMAPMMALGGIVMALIQDLRLSWLILVAVPLLLVPLGFMVARMVPKFRLMQERLDSLNRILREQLTGIRVIRAFTREATERTRFAHANGELATSYLQTGALFALMFPVAMVVLNLSSVAVIWFGGLQVEAGTTEVGTMMAFLQYLMQILMGIMMATFMTMMIPRASVSATRVAEVLDTAPSILPPSNPVTTLEEPGTVAFEGVSFHYRGAEAPVLDNVSFRVARGSTTAIIGSTGSGKTTLVNLVPRLLEASSGRVLVGGVDVRTLSPSVLYAHLGLVPQKAFLFSGTIADNLRYGKPDADDERLWTALRAAQAADFVTALDEGLDAPVSQGGTNFSGGQRQRLSIARALVHDPAILLLDDAFSALDTATDARLRFALDREYPGTTRLVVAQRVASILSADHIVVLDDGVVVGEGTHQGLLVDNAVYQEIVSSQLGTAVAE